jgi:tetratricopeptide (TPR) repeat protein
MNRLSVLTLTILLTGFLYAQQKNFDASLKEAQSLKSQGKLQEAAYVLRQAIQQFPENAEAHYQLATILGELSGSQANAGDFTNAMSNVNESFAELEKATSLDPNHFNAHFFYGVYSLNIPAFFGRLEPGVQHLENAKALMNKQPSQFPADQQAALYRFLGQGYRMIQRPKDAEAAWNKVLSLVSQGENADAARKGLEELRKDTDQKPKVGGQVSAVGGQKDSGSAEDVSSLIELGKGYLNQKKWTDAADAFRKAIQKDSANVQSYLMLAKALGEEAGIGYDERIYEDQTWRTNLAFEVERVIEKAHKLDPNNAEIQLFNATMCIQMPFFVGRMDEGLSILESMSKNPNLPDSIRSEAVYQLGYGYRKKGRGIWADFVKNNPDTKQASSVYEEFGLREHASKSAMGERVQVTFHLGFQDELEPQTGLWVEDKDGKFVKTLYVSGFSGFAKEKQVVLPEFAKRTKFETDGTTGASIDWGKYTYSWDLMDHAGKRVKSGVYKIVLEISWWPSMRYETAEAAIRVGGAASETVVSKEPLIPRMQAQYIPKK